MPHHVPRKLTPETEASVLAAIRSGVGLDTAASYSGIDKQTLMQWLKWGAEEEKESETGPCRTFREKVMKALATVEIADMARIAQASETWWQAAAWRLERRHPEKYGKRRAEALTKSEFALFIDQLAELLTRYLDPKQIGQLMKEVQVLVERLEFERQHA